MQVTYLGCVLDEMLSADAIILKTINKLNWKLKFLFRKNRCLTKELCRMLYNALIQLHFDYECPAWYPNLDKKKKNRKENANNAKQMHTLFP